MSGARDPADLQTPEDACRSLPSDGPDWDAAIAYGVQAAWVEKVMATPVIELA